MQKKQKLFFDVVALEAGNSKESIFTYHSDAKILPGQLVMVSFGSKKSLAITKGEAQKPTFSTKAISEIYDLVLPPHLAQLASWASNYYASPQSIIWKTFLPTSPQIPSKHSKVKQEISSYGSSRLTPTKEQSQAIATILQSEKQNFLLHGTASSGKTQVYIELIRTMFNKGLSSLLLVPEISLTPQMYMWVNKAFGNKVLLTHSGLTPSTRRAIWQKAYSASQPHVVIGPRSALFTPLPKLGLIVIDEAHDSSYKHDQAPRFFAPTMAAKLASLTGAKLILGTATPLVGDIFLSQHKKLELINMPTPVHQANPASVEIIDLRDKSTYKSGSKSISQSLYSALETTLQRQKQSIIFLNRRGSAHMQLCSDCGRVADCPRCKIPLTWHADNHKLRCHWCNFSQAPLIKCMGCGSSKLRYIGSGTKNIEQEIKRFLPKANIYRLDRDSFSPKSLESTYAELKNGEIDILIGTQMITKGLDLPNVETVGIILADQMLHLPDYTSGERTFQLISQVRGRAGRRPSAISNIVIQTYSPTHPAIVAAASSNYKKFVDTELAERKKHKYPPYIYLLKLWVQTAKRETARANSIKLANSIKKNPGVDVVGPAPSWRETYRGNYTWQIVVKSKSRKILQQIAEGLPSGWSHDLEPIDLL